MFDKALITLKFAASCVLLLTTAQLAGAAGLPDGIDAQGKTPVLSLHAEGVQIYDCKADSAGKPAWQFREPLATLLQDNKTVGRHFAGPTWELADGTAIVGKVAAQAPGRTANDIAVLKLDVVNHRGMARFQLSIRSSVSTPMAACSKARAHSRVQSMSNPIRRIIFFLNEPNGWHDG
jgi:hypothetical protein